MSVAAREREKERFSVIRRDILRFLQVIFCFLRFSLSLSVVDRSSSKSVTSRMKWIIWQLCQQWVCARKRSILLQTSLANDLIVEVKRLIRHQNSRDRNVSPSTYCDLARVFSPVQFHSESTERFLASEWQEYQSLWGQWVESKHLPSCSRYVCLIFISINEVWFEYLARLAVKWEEDVIEETHNWIPFPPMLADWSMKVSSQRTSRSEN
jgi:hypothetical protein